MKLNFTVEEQRGLDELRLERNRFLVNILQGLYSGWDEYWGYEGLLPELRRSLCKGERYWGSMELGEVIQEVEIFLESWGEGW